ncbi:MULTISPECIES: NACHT domain-containing protein [unclassified Saccharothrix]|uniref:NACHT domain-containing protein n=1 Tax=unclassified Saccharothrix TaxID=2593673 RepID=UPI00307E7FAE
MRRSSVAYGFSVLSVIGIVVVGALADAASLPDNVRSWLWLLVALLTVATVGFQLRTFRTDPGARLPVDLLADAFADSVRRQPAATDVSLRVPLRWAGPSDLDAPDTETLASAFRALPERRMVIVGEPGSGKTAAAHRLALELLDTRAPGDPVPVVLPLARWTGEVVFSEWLPAEYPQLTALGGPDSARSLVMSDLVLPIFDGFDEMAPVGRTEFLSWVRGTFPSFVITSRRPVRATAPVLQLLPLRPLHVARYLRDQVPDGDHRWAPLLAFLADHPTGPLARALSSPRALGLVLRAYASPQTQPAELLDPTRFADVDAIERHLLETALVRAASGTATDGYQPGERAADQLGYLAAHLDRLDTTDLAWWRLRASVPRAVFVGAALVVGAVTGLVTGLLLGVWTGVLLGEGVAVMVSVGLGLNVASVPFPTRIRLGRRSLVVLALGVLIGAVTAAVVGALGGSLGSVAQWSAVGVVGGVFAALRVAVTGSRDVDVARHPQDSLWRDRRMALAQGAVTGLTVALAVGLTGGFERDVLLVVCMGLGAGLVGVSFSAYALYSVSRVWLALRGRLPWRLMTFLEAERQLGLLRHSGGVYQFHHRRLQEHLAAEYGAAKPPVDEDAVRMVGLLRGDLVERAFARADVQAVIEAPSIRRLQDEIVAEIEDTREDLVVATSAARERYVAVKERLLARAGVPRVARGARFFGHVSGPLAALAGGAALAAGGRSAVILPVVWTALVVTAAAFLLQPTIWRLNLAVDEDGRSRVVERLARWHSAVAVRLAPLHRVHHSVYFGVGLSCLLLISSAAAPLEVVAVMRSIRPTWMYIVGGAAVVFGLLWVWARPLKKRWDALSVDNPAVWPAETALPRGAAQARRDAVRAWEALVEALVENGVLPMVAARVEVLAQRSYDTRLPDASVKRLGDLTESAQFVPTDTSARLNRMLDAMSGGAIGLSGPRGIGKSTVLGIFGDRRLGGNPDDLTVVVPAPTNYNSRDFLVHLFSRMCMAVLPPDTRTARVTSRRVRVRWLVTAVIAVLLVAGAVLWPSAVEAGRWAWRNVRGVAVGAGLALLVALVVEMVVRRGFRRGDTSVEDTARAHLRALRYLETTTRTATAAVKPGVELGGSLARQRAEQVKTYPELVGEFRDFLAFLVSHLPTRPDRRAPRIVVCIDEVDKIATAEAAEQFINDVKTVFGVPGCFFLVAVSEDALASFSRRALTVRTAFDSAFDNVIQVSRLSLTQTRRLLVQRVLRLPEPYVWLCHALSAGLPRDLNRTVRQLYDIRAATGVSDLGDLAGELVRQDLEVVTHGQVLQVNSGSDAVSGALLRWLAQTARVPIDHDSLVAHRDNAPSAGVALRSWPPELWAVRERFQAYLSYAAAVLQSFQERSAEVITHLSTVDTDEKNPVRHLADARAHLSVDAALATSAVEAYRSELV